MTYLVMEVHLSYCVVVDEIGRFIKAANLRYEVGQRIESIIELKAPEKAAKKFNIAALGSIAACFALCLSLYWYNYMLPFGMIYLSVNPDVQIEISRRDTVVGLSGLNGDGELLLAGYKYGGKHTADVTDDLMDKAIELGFISDGDTVVISIDAPNDEWLVENGILLRQQLETHLADKIDVKIIIEIYDAENWPKPLTPSSTEENTPSPIPQSPSSDYGNDSNYGGDDSGSTDYQAPPQSSPPAKPQSSSNNDSLYGDSGYSEYGGNSYGDSEYQVPSQSSAHDNYQPASQDSGYSDISERNNDSDYGNDSGYSGYSGYSNDSEYDD